MDNVQVRAGETGMICNYMLLAIVKIAGKYNLNFYLASDIWGKPYITIHDK